MKINADESREILRLSAFIYFTNPRSSVDDLSFLMNFLEPEPLPQGAGRSGAVERVEMQPRCSALEQLVAQFGGDVETEGANGIEVLAKTFQPAADPARDLGPADIGKFRQLLVIGDRHDARHDRHVSAERVRFLDETPI